MLIVDRLGGSAPRLNPWDTIYEGNPQQILERREPVARCRC